MSTKIYLTGLVIIGFVLWTGLSGLAMSHGLG